MENVKSNTADRELSIERTLNAPVELVWEVFTKPEHISNWWGPNIKCVGHLAKAAGFDSCELVWWRQDVHFGGRGKRACFHLR